MGHSSSLPAHQGSSEASQWRETLCSLHPLAWGTQVRLVEEELSYGSFGEAYEANCARYGREVDLPIVLFKRRCSNHTGQLVHDPTQEMRLAVRALASTAPLTQHLGGGFAGPQQRPGRRTPLRGLGCGLLFQGPGRRAAQPQGPCTAEPAGAQAYREVEQKVVSETIFSQFMYKILPSCNHLFVFKKQLCTQMALSGVPRRGLCTPGRAQRRPPFAPGLG